MFQNLSVDFLNQVKHTIAGSTYTVLSKAPDSSCHYFNVNNSGIILVPLDGTVDTAVTFDCRFLSESIAATDVRGIVGFISAGGSLDVGDDCNLSGTLQTILPLVSSSIVNVPDSTTFNLFNYRGTVHYPRDLSGNYNYAFLLVPSGSCHGLIRPHYEEFSTFQPAK